MKKYLLIVIAFLVTVSANSQQQESRFKDTRNIYLLDVTLSMWGKSPGAKNIFNEVRSELINVINATANERTEIVVVPFQDRIIDTWEFKATKNGKEKIIEKLNAINAENVPKQNTNIHGAWQKGKNLINPSKLNVVFLLTDGEHSVKHTSKETLYREVSDWSKFASKNDYYAFLVELTDQAKDEKLRQVVQRTEHAQIIQGIEFFVLSIEEDKPIVNTHDQLSFKINLIGDRISNIPEDFSYTLFLNDPNFKIINNRPKRLTVNGSRVELEPIHPIKELQDKLEQESQIKFYIEYDEQKYPQVKILNKTIICTVKNNKEMVLTIEVLKN
jgi:hypothetical protein